MTRFGQQLGVIGGYECWSDHLHFGVYLGDFDTSVGEYPSWLVGYVSNDQFPGNWEDPSDFIATHEALSAPLASFTPSTFGIEGPAGNLICGIKRSAQTFTSTTTGRLADIVLRIRKNEQAGTNNAAIFVRVAAGTPFGDPPQFIEMSQNTIPIQSLTTDSTAVHTFVFSGNTILTAGYTYTIILDATAFTNCNNDTGVGGTGQIPDTPEWTGGCTGFPPGPYVDGISYKQLASNGTWPLEDTGCDFYFIVHGLTLPP